MGLQTINESPCFLQAVMHMGSILVVLLEFVGLQVYLKSS